MANNPYTEVTVTGYNSNPPPDDGTQNSSNEITWAKHKTKIGDPLKTAIEAVDDNVLAAFAKTINTDDAEANTINGSLAFGTDELTIATGAITPDRSNHTVDTESDASSDDLDTINTSGVSDGAILILRAANGGRTVVLKHDTGAGPKIFLATDTDYSLDDAEKTIVLQRIGSAWYEVSRTYESPSVSHKQVVSAAVVATSGSTTFPADDTPPTVSEGTEVWSQSITPTSASNSIKVQGVINVSGPADVAFAVAVFRGSTCISVSSMSCYAITQARPMPINVMDAPATTSSTTYTIRVGLHDGTGTWYVSDSGTARFSTAIAGSTIELIEVDTSV